MISISWTQVIYIGFSTAVGSIFGTITAFLVMRYFPKLWESLEKITRKSLTGITRPDHEQDKTGGQ